MIVLFCSLTGRNIGVFLVKEDERRKGMCLIGLERPCGFACGVCRTKIHRHWPHVMWDGRGHVAEMECDPIVAVLNGGKITVCHKCASELWPGEKLERLSHISNEALRNRKLASFELFFGVSGGSLCDTLQRRTRMGSEHQVVTV